MTRLSVVVALFAAVAVIGCVKDSTTDQKDTADKRPARASELADSPPAQAPDVCALLSAKEIEEIAGVPLERAEKKPNGCDWYANAAAQQQKGADTARGTLASLLKEEPKSAQDGVKTMENLMKGLGGAVAPNKPLFAVLVQRENADAAEAMLKTTVAVNGGSAGGGLEPIEGLGDRAFIGAMGAIFYVRKGNTLITLGSMTTREQAIALARRIVPRIK